MRQATARSAGSYFQSLATSCTVEVHEGAWSEISSAELADQSLLVRNRLSEILTA